MISTYGLFKTLIPELDDIQIAIVKGTMVSAILTKTLDESWKVQLVESYRTKSQDFHFEGEKLRDIVNWTEEQLKNWPYCVRSSYDTWVFQSKRKAEKFLIIFNLKWAQ